MAVPPPPDLRLSVNQARPRRSFTKFLPPSQRKSHSLRIPTRRRRDQNIEPVPGVQIARPPPPHSPPVFPVYNLTLSPLTAALYYLNAWNRLSLFITLRILECESKHWKKSDLDVKRLESNCQVSHETTNFTARYQQGKQRNKS